MKNASKRKPDILSDNNNGTAVEENRADLFSHVAFSALWSTQRLLSAQNVFLRSLKLLYEKHGPELVATVDPWQDFENRVKENDREPPPLAIRFHWFQALTRLGYLTYATTIFDSFLSDTTRFLFLTDLAAMGEDCRVPIAVLTNPKARAKVVNEEVTRKVRSLSYGSFEQRLDFLRSRFKLKFDVSSHDASLRRLSELRNGLAHDSSLFGFSLDESNFNQVIAKGESSDPSLVKDEDVDKALKTYSDVIVAVYRTVQRDVFNCAVDDSFTGLV